MKERRRDSHGASIVRFPDVVWATTTTRAPDVIGAPDRIRGVHATVISVAPPAPRAVPTQRSSTRSRRTVDSAPSAADTSGGGAAAASRPARSVSVALRAQYPLRARTSNPFPLIFTPI